MAKRKKLKKCVKAVSFFLIIMILGIAIYFFRDTFDDVVSNNFSDDNVVEDIDNNEDSTSGDKDSSVEEGGVLLNRVTYKDGFYYEDISLELKDKITGYSFPNEFDSNYTAIAYEDLRYVRVKYYDFDGAEHTDGEIIVHKLVAQDVVEIFYNLYLEKYPMTSIKLVEEFNASDELSMRANNTSAFNYRIVENIDRLAWHAFGLAIDINPLYNPYVVDGDIYPGTASQYVDRSLDFDGKIDHDDLAYRLFTEYGWKWGGDFKYSKDYQHFYKEALDSNVRERKG